MALLRGGAKLAEVESAELPGTQQHAMKRLERRYLRTRDINPRCHGWRMWQRRAVKGSARSIKRRCAG